MQFQQGKTNRQQKKMLSWFIQITIWIWWTKGVGNAGNTVRTHKPNYTHMHTHTYIYMCVCVCKLFIIIYIVYCKSKHTYVYHRNKSNFDLSTLISQIPSHTCWLCFRFQPRARLFQVKHRWHQGWGSWAAAKRLERKQTVSNDIYIHVFLCNMMLMLGSCRQTNTSLIAAVTICMRSLCEVIERYQQIPKIWMVYRYTVALPNNFRIPCIQICRTWHKMALIQNNTKQKHVKCCQKLCAHSGKQNDLQIRLVVPLQIMIPGQVRRTNTDQSETTVPNCRYGGFLTPSSACLDQRPASSSKELNILKT
jgi:hypothetical protein